MKKDMSKATNGGFLKPESLKPVEEVVIPSDANEKSLSNSSPLKVDMSTASGGKLLTDNK